MKTFVFICQTLLFTGLSLAVEEDHHDCPVGAYRCLKSDKCIDLDWVCNGRQDCPDGDDELSTYCKETQLANELSNKYDNYNPGNQYARAEADSYLNRYISNDTLKTIEKVEEENRFWINNGCPAGRYLCNGTLDLCVRLENVCDKRVDCPNRDDEDWTICKNWPKYKQTEYSGVDNKLQAVDGEHQEVDNGKDNGNTDSFEGQGFMFHVDNLVIYNSDVKMFDQSSDNVKVNSTV